MGPWSARHHDPPHQHVDDGGPDDAMVELHRPELQALAEVLRPVR